jgi:hypothetical protein
MIFPHFFNAFDEAGDSVKAELKFSAYAVKEFSDFVLKNVLGPSNKGWIWGAFSRR